jgi:hypothetical protein
MIFGGRKGLNCDKKLIPFNVCHFSGGFEFHYVLNSTIYEIFYSDYNDGLCENMPITSIDPETFCLSLLIVSA